MAEKKKKGENSDFTIKVSSFDEMINKTHFTTEVTLMKCVSGSAVIAINARKHTFSEKQIFILSDLVVFQVLETTKDFSVTCCRISLPFFFELTSVLNIDIFRVLRYGGPDLYKEDDLKLANLLFQSICLLYNNKTHRNRRDMVMHLIISFIYEMYEQTVPLVVEDVENDKRNKYTNTVNAFYHLVFEHHYKERGIEFYAQKLNMSSRYLYKIVQKSIFITPKKLIDDVVLSFIKQTLLNSELHNQEIADRYCFPDLSSFGQYFKRCTGMSPSAFRNKYR